MQRPVRLGGVEPDQARRHLPEVAVQAEAGRIAKPRNHWLGVCGIGCPALLIREPSANRINIHQVALNMHQPVRRGVSAVGSTRRPVQHNRVCHGAEAPWMAGLDCLAKALGG